MIAEKVWAPIWDIVDCPKEEAIVQVNSLFAKVRDQTWLLDTGWQDVQWEWRPDDS